MREEKLLNYLKGACTGRKYRASGAELEAALGISGTDLRKLVNRMRRKGIPIGSDRCGYFYADDCQAEVKAQRIQQLQSWKWTGGSKGHGLERSLDAFPLKEGASLNSFIPWVGGKGKLLWIINKLMPDHYKRFIDVFGGSGTVTISRPIQRGCMEVYNDYNGNLTNLFCCVKNRTMALLAELGFLPLNTRDTSTSSINFSQKMRSRMITCRRR